MHQLVDFVCSSARNHGNDFVERADDVNERERSILQFNRNLRKFPSLNPRLFNYIINEDYIPSEQERLPTPARRAQAIVKGDPREFMG